MYFTKHDQYYQYDQFTNSPFSAYFLGDRL